MKFSQKSDLGAPRVVHFSDFGCFGVGWKKHDFSERLWRLKKSEKSSQRAAKGCQPDRSNSTMDAFSAAKVPRGSLFARGKPGEED